MEEVIPREITKPGVVFDVFWAVQSQSVKWFALDQAVDEVSSLN